MEKGQAAVWGLLAMTVLIAVVGGLVDVYRLLEARNWAYSVAQEAALTGASYGRDWSSILSTGGVRLDPTVAQSRAESLVRSEMAGRGITDYHRDVRVLPDPGGGEIGGYPALPTRLGVGRGDWSSNEPAVGVYLTVPVNWLILDSLGVVSKSVSVFASAGVAQ